MPVDLANATELTTIAREVGAEVVGGNLRYPSETGSWQLGEVDLGEYLDRYRDQRMMLVFVPLSETEKATCGQKISNALRVVERQRRGCIWDKKFLRIVTI